MKIGQTILLGGSIVNRSSISMSSELPDAKVQKLLAASAKRKRLTGPGRYYLYAVCNDEGGRASPILYVDIDFQFEITSKCNCTIVLGTCIADSKADASLYFGKHSPSLLPLHCWLSDQCEHDYKE